MEGTETATPQTLTDIQSYLDTFNKEIQDGMYLL